MKSIFKIIYLLTLICSILNAQNKLNPKGIDIPLDLPSTYNPDKRCNSVKKLSYYVQMRDSVMIAVDVYLPKNINKAEKLPVILHQTRYWRSVGFIWPIKTFKHMVLSGDHYNVLEFAKQGYALVVADVRGTGASTGIKTTGSPDIKEILDGKELVNWILKQPWSNGKIGATGISYIGTTAEMLLINRNPAVKAVAPMYAGFDLYDDIARPGGIYYSRFLKSWNKFNKALDSNKLPDFKRTFITKLVVTGVSKPKKGRKIFKIAQENHKLNAYNWEEGYSPEFSDDSLSINGKSKIEDFISPHRELEKIDNQAAVYSYSGWMDNTFQHAAIKMYMNFPNPNNKLIIGPWDHGGTYCIDAGKTSVSGFDHFGEILKFFDFHLKGISNGTDIEPKIQYFTQNEKKWKSSDSWPPKGVSVEAWYLADNKSITNKIPNIGIVPYSVDTNSHCGKVSRWVMVGYKNLPNENRADLDKHNLFFDSEILTNKMEITGHPVIELSLKSSEKDPYIFVYLEDVHPDGKVTLITDGQLRGIHKKVIEGEKPYNDLIPTHSYKRTDIEWFDSTQFEKVVIDFQPTSYLLQEGHKLRISIAGYENSYFNVHTKKGNWEIKCGENDTKLILPIMKN